ncbi:solute carrier family 2 member 9, like 1 [Spinachia spinachia]
METLLQQLTRGNALLLIIVLGIGGSFQSGYHSTELSSASPYIQSFINSSWFHRYKEPPPPRTITIIWSLIVSMYAVGGLFGAFSVKLITGTLGRKKAMICTSFIAIVAGGIMLTSKGAKSYELIIVARILYGFSSGLGASSHVMYLAEISPRKIRGTVTLTSAIFLSLGKLFGQFFGLSELLGRQELWNIVLLVPALFSVVQVIVLPFLPEAPRYLFIEKGYEKACKKALQSLWGEGDYKQEMDEMLTEQAAIEAAPPKSTLQLLRDRNVRWQLLVMSVVYCCNQLSGIPAINIFSFDVFQKAGIPTDKIRYVTLGLGVSQIITSIFCGLLIEQSGRRLLFWGGYGLMSGSLLLLTVMLNLKVGVAEGRQGSGDTPLIRDVISCSLRTVPILKSGSGRERSKYPDVTRPAHFTGNASEQACLFLWEPNIPECISSQQQQQQLDKRRPSSRHGSTSASKKLIDSSYWSPYISASSIFLFTIFFCGGPGGASTTLHSEIFIQSDRLAAFVLLGMLRWLLYAVLGLVFPFLIDTLDSYCFVLFTCVCLLGCLYTFFLLPETKGKTLLEISADFKAIAVCGKSFSEEKRLETKL